MDEKERVFVVSFRLLPDFRKRSLRFEIAILDKQNKEFYILYGSASKLITTAGLKMVKDWVADVALNIVNNRGSVDFDILTHLLDYVEMLGQTDLRGFIRRFNKFCTKLESFIEEVLSENVSSNSKQPAEDFYEIPLSELMGFGSYDEGGDKYETAKDKLKRLITVSQNWGLPPVCRQDLSHLD